MSKFPLERLDPFLVCGNKLLYKDIHNNLWRLIPTNDVVAPPLKIVKYAHKIMQFDPAYIISILNNIDDGDSDEPNQ